MPDSAPARHNYSNPVDWVFRNRENGRITIVQRPNIPLWGFLALLAARVLLHPGGNAGLGLAVLSAVVLLVWAGLEALRGVNPFRRALGVVVGLAQLAMLLTLR